MRLCFVCSEYPPSSHGGIGSFVQRFGRALVQAGHQVRVVGIYAPTTPEAEYEVDQGVQVWRLRHSSARLGWVSARYRLYRTIAAWSRQGEIDLVEVPDWHGWAAFWPKLSVPLVVRLHGCSTYFAVELAKPTDRLTFWLEQASLGRAEAWCSVSQYTARKTQQLLKPRRPCSQILYNAAEFISEQDTVTRSTNRVVFAGTLTAKKGIIALVQAWPQVLAAMPDAELHIYGKDGFTEARQSMRAYLLDQLTPLAQKSVVFHGHITQSELRRAYQEAALAVLPSYAEAFALVPLEAMACGCPMVYTRRCSGPELIEDNKTGLLIDPDQPDEIVSAITCILGNPNLADQLGKAGQAHVRQNFALTTLLADNERFYQSCLTPPQIDRALSNA